MAKPKEETAAKEPKAPKVERIKQNDVMKPKDGSKCGQAWDVFDETSKQKGSQCTAEEALPLAEQRGLNLGNVRAEYGRWRKFYGLPPIGRAKKPKEEAPAEAPAEG